MHDLEVLCSAKFRLRGWVADPGVAGDHDRVSPECWIGFSAWHGHKIAPHHLWLAARHVVLAVTAEIVVVVVAVVVAVVVVNSVRKNQDG